jgi:hypothetical protein
MSRPIYSQIITCDSNNRKFLFVEQEIESFTFELYKKEQRRIECVTSALVDAENISRISWRKCQRNLLCDVFLKGRKVIEIQLCAVAIS